MSRSVRILYISHERKMGGGNLSLLDLVTEMKNRGHRVAVVVLFRGCPIDIALKKEGIETFPCFFGWWMQPADWNIVLKIAFRFLHWMQWLSVLRISNYVKREGFDIIHSNSSVIDIGAQVAAKAGIKHIWHFREFGELHFHFEYMLGKEKSLRYVNEHSDRVVFISEALKKGYPQIQNGLQIYDGIRDECFYGFQHNSRAIVHDKFVFLVTGAITRGKNQKIILDAVRILNDRSLKQYYNGEYEVLFAGEATSLSDSKKYKVELIDYTSAFNITNIRFLGFVKDMRLLRERADAEIVASLNEAYGRVAIEAMASGNLVLASRSGSNIELIGNDERGYLFDSIDPIDLATKMRQVLLNRKAIGNTVDKAFRYAFQYHRMTESVTLMENVYGEIVNG